MSEVDEFLSTTLDRVIEAEQAMLLNGDLAPMLAMWSTQNPVTLFGLDATKHGAEAVRRTLHWVPSWFTDCTAYRFELVAAGVSGDLAYTVAFEHASVSIGGGPVQPLTNRATQVYRREDGQWKIVHRHSDQPPIDQPPIDQGLPPRRRPARRQGQPASSRHPPGPGGGSAPTS
jgi:ketosteroid isomerase-like protein